MPKRKMLNISEKIDLIKLVDNSPHKRRKDIAALYGIPVNTVCSIYANREKILEQCNSNFVNLNMKKLRGSSFPEIEDALLEWYIKNHANANDCKISGIVLREKALELAKGFGRDSFLATSGWIERFKARHNIAVDKPRKKRCNTVTKPADSSQTEYSESSLVWENISNPLMELTEIPNDDTCNSNPESHNSVHSSGGNSEVSCERAVYTHQNYCVTRSVKCEPHCNNNNNMPTSRDADEAFDIIFNFVKSSKNVDEITLNALEKLKNFIVNEKNVRKQTKITDYFAQI